MLASVGMPARVVLLPPARPASAGSGSAVRDGRDLQERQRRVRRPDVARELRHRVAGVAVLVLRHAHVRQDLPSITTSAPAMHRWSTARRELDPRPRMAPATVTRRSRTACSAPRRTCDRKIAGSRPMFTETEPLAQGLRLGPERVDVGWARRRWTARRGPARTCGGWVTRFLHVAQQQAQAEVRASVDGGVRRSREQGAQVEVGVLGAVHDLLAGRLLRAHVYRRNRVGQRVPMRWVSSRGGQSSSMPTRSGWP